MNEAAKIRHKKGLTKAQMAAHCRVDVKTIYNWENNVTPMPAGMVDWMKKARKK